MGVVDEPDKRDPGNDIFGLNNLFRPFDGDNTEVGLCCWSVKLADAMDVTDAVDDFLKPFIAKPSVVFRGVLADAYDAFEAG